MKWIILSNKRQQNYDLDDALHDCGVDWNRNKNKIETGDTVYIYESKPEQYIRYKCVVTADSKTVSTFNDEAYGGIKAGMTFDDFPFETQLVYEFKEPVTLDELANYGVSKKRVPVMKETGKPEVFRFLEKYEAEDRLREGQSSESETDPDLSRLPGGERETTAKERIHQAEFRERLLKKYNHCCLCSVSNHDLLNASHIKPWNKSEPAEKTDINNGLLLCPNHDRLFDKGFISFSRDGSIIISEELSENDRMFMNVSDSMAIEMNEKMESFMEYHREHVFRG